MALKVVKVGFIAHSLINNFFAYEALRLALADPRIQVEFLLVLSESEEGMTTRFRARLRNLPYKFWRCFEFTIARFFNLECHKALSIWDLTELLGSTTVKEFSSVRIKGGVAAKPECIEFIRRSDAVVIGRLSGSILKGDILSATSRGIYSVHHGDSLTLRGGPPGFWEIIERRPMSVTTVQVLSDRLDGGQVISRQPHVTRPIYSLNLSSMMIGSVHQFVRALVETNPSSNVDPVILSTYLRGIYKNPTAVYVALYLCRVAQAIGLRVLSCFRRSPRWEVFYASLTADSPRHRRLVAPDADFFADPFSVSLDDKTYFFVEHFLGAQQRGVISVITLDANYKQEAIATDILQTGGHYSFPRVLRLGEKFYLSVDSTERTGLALFEAVEFPSRWKRLPVPILDSYRVCDPIMILENDEVFITFSHSLDPQLRDDFVSELSAFSAPTRVFPQGLKQVCIVSQNNEIGQGVRNGGLIRVEGVNYRVGQVFGFDFYGKSIQIHRLNFDDQDVIYGAVVHDIQLRRKGVHTLNYDGTMMTYDIRNF